MKNHNIFFKYWFYCFECNFC